MQAVAMPHSDSQHSRSVGRIPGYRTAASTYNEREKKKFKMQTKQGRVVEYLCSVNTPLNQ